MGEHWNFFDQVSCSGSYLNSMEMIARGEVDAAVIDSNVLRIKLRSTPELCEQLRVLESWGPFLIQPVVVRSALPLELKAHLRAGLLTLERGSGTTAALAKFGLERFAPTTYEHYAPEKQALRECERALGSWLC